MEKSKLRELINSKVESALCEYYEALETENECHYSGDIYPLELLHWDELVEDFADLFERLAEHNKS